MQTDNLVNNSGDIFDPLMPTAYNEAIPNQLNILDLFDIDASEEAFANKWVTTLLNKNKAIFSVHPSTFGQRKIAHLFFSSRNNEKIKGSRNIGFAYPILVKKDRNASSGLMAAPVFIWSVDIEPTPVKSDTWQLVEQSQPMRINPLLTALSPEAAALVREYEAKLRFKTVDTLFCDEFCKQLSVLLNYQNERPSYGVERFPEIEDLVTIQEPGALVWSGVFGSFPPLHFYALSNSILSKDFWQEKLNATDYKDLYHFCYLPCDHQQKAAHIASFKNKFIMVEGAAGSGKTHTLVNFVINNLMNKQKTLIVGSNVIELERVMDKLQAEGFGDLAFLFKKPDLDKGNLADRLIAKADKTLKFRPSDAQNFSMEYRRYDQCRKQMDEAVADYSKNIFDINNWTETVGLFLKNNQQEGKELLDNQLQQSDFSFDFLEYERVKEQIAISERLFQDYFSFAHPLDDLDESVFESNDGKEAKRSLQSQLNHFLNKGRQVQRQYLGEISAYKQALEDHYEDWDLSLKQKLENTKEAIDHLQFQFGDTYHSSRLGNLKLLRNFSEKSRKAHQLKSQIAEKYETLSTHFQKQKYFEFDFFNKPTDASVEKIKAQLSDFEQALKNWQLQRPNLIQENISRLNSKTIHSGIGFTQRIGILEQAVEALRLEVNEAKLYRIPIKNNAMTLQLKQQLLEDLLEKLNVTLYNLRDFEAFYDWRRHWATLANNEKKVVKMLIKVRPKNWSAAFDSWYFHNLLTKENKQNPNFDLLLNQYLTAYNQVKSQISNFIIQVWAAERYRILHIAKNKSRNDLSKFLNKANATKAFEDYFKKHFSKIAGFFPILLMTTATVKELMQGNPSIKVDNLLLTEGANMTKEQGGSLLGLANKVQVFGTGKASLIPAGQSFWEIAEGMAGKHVQLKNQHRKTAIPLLAFNNAAFGQQLQITFNGYMTDASLEIYQIDGTYNEKNKINEEECKFALSLIHQIQGTPQNTFPKVGIVCATLEQRNHFATSLLQLKQERTANAQRIRHLERNGLGVYGFEEINGQQFDILIVSFTYGIPDKGGQVTEAIKMLNTPKGERILQCVLSSGIQKVIICSSISSAFIKDFANRPDERGFYILANFLAYTKALKRSDTEKVLAILDQFSLDSSEVPEGESSFFLEQVAEHLKLYFEAERINRMTNINGQKFALSIKGKYENQPSYVIKVDSFANNAEAFSYIWQMQLNKEIEAKGYKLLQIWSKNWWRNPEQEARKLASIIIQDDAAYAAQEEIETMV